MPSVATVQRTAGLQLLSADRDSDSGPVVYSGMPTRLRAHRTSEGTVHCPLHA